MSTLLFDIMQTQRKRSAPFWLKEKPYIKVKFIKDGYILKVTEYSKPLQGSLANYTFQTGQDVWCYWKKKDEKEKAYSEAEVIEMWDDSTTVEENLPHDEPEEIVEGKLEKYFAPLLHANRSSNYDLVH